MQITAVNLPENFLQLGLKQTAMGRLGSVVVLAGPNGGGKSRLLQCVFGAVRNYLPSPQQESHRADMASQRRAQAKLRLKLAVETDESIRMSLQQQIREHERWVQRHEETLAVATLVTLKGFRNDKPVHHYVPKPVDLVDPFLRPRNDTLVAANQVRAVVGFDSLSSGCLAYIGNVQDRWFHATHPQVTLAENEKAQAVEEYQRRGSSPGRRCAPAS